jgi:hypothetical protein
MNQKKKEHLLGVAIFVLGVIVPLVIATAF